MYFLFKWDSRSKWYKAINTQYIIKDKNKLYKLYRELYLQIMTLYESRKAIGNNCDSLQTKIHFETNIVTEITEAETDTVRLDPAVMAAL